MGCPIVSLLSQNVVQQCVGITKPNHYFKSQQLLYDTLLAKKMTEVTEQAFSLESGLSC